MLSFFLSFMSSLIPCICHLSDIFLSPMYFILLSLFHFILNIHIVFIRTCSTFVGRSWHRFILFHATYLHLSRHPLSLSLPFHLFLDILLHRFLHRSVRHPTAITRNISLFHVTLLSNLSCSSQPFTQVFCSSDDISLQTPLILMVQCSLILWLQISLKSESIDVATQHHCWVWGEERNIHRTVIKWGALKWRLYPNCQ